MSEQGRLIEGVPPDGSVVRRNGLPGPHLVVRGAVGEEVTTAFGGVCVAAWTEGRGYWAVPLDAEGRDAGPMRWVSLDVGERPGDARNEAAEAGSTGEGGA